MNKTTARVALGFAVYLLALLMVSTMAQAAGSGNTFGIEMFDGAVSESDGAAFTQAGGHPFDITTAISFVSSGQLGRMGRPVPDGNVKDIHVELPAGFIGNPRALPTCSEDQIEGGAFLECPPESQVGTATVDVPNLFPAVAVLPVFNLEAPSGLPGQFGFNLGGQAVVHMMPSVRSGSDYGLNIDVRNVSQASDLTSTTLTLWGVPFDRAHDPFRARRGAGIVCFMVAGRPFCPAGGESVSLLARPFLTNPTHCSGEPLTTMLSVDSWQNPGVFRTASFVSHDADSRPVTLVGCERLPFEPSLSMQPSSVAASRPSGYTVRLRMPQNDNPTGLAQAALRRATVRLPDGVSVSPSSANGLGACAPEQIRIASADSPTCPDSAKIGTVTIETPLLDRPMTGSVYLAQPTSRQLLKIYLVAEGSGVVIKLPGNIDPERNTGRLTATFENNPQLPFSELIIRFKDGPRAALVNPPTCGPATTTATFTAWSGAVATSTDTFQVSADGHGAPCPARGFNPSFTAGTVNPIGGKDSPFTLTFSRSDQDHALGNISLEMPEGLLGRIASLPLCADPQSNAGTCDEGSRIGSTTTGAGAGASPYYLPGRVYITGPYKGAPFGMSIVVPAVAGPFDLGTVVVRAAIFVDPTTSALRVVSDPLPTILQGIPLQIRTVNVLIDRDGFMFNPTDCSPSSVRGRISSSSGDVKDVSSRFQVADCGSLPFRPKMTLKVGARGRTGRNNSTPLAVTLSMTRGQANNRSVQVTLPDTINARLPVINRACTLEEYRAGNCEKARAGQAVAVTPLLRDPLRGPAYFVRNPARRLPDLMVQLRGQVSMDLTGKISIVNNRLLRTRFDTVPDVPITMFRLNLVAGRQGPVGAVLNLCSRRGRRGSVARLAFRGQNGKLVKRNQRIQIVGCGREKVKK